MARSGPPDLRLAVNTVQIGFVVEGDLERDLRREERSAALCQPDESGCALSQSADERIGTNLVVGAKHECTTSGSAKRPLRTRSAALWVACVDGIGADTGVGA